MFDLPARFKQDERNYAVKIKTRSHFRRAEAREITSRGGPAGSVKLSEAREMASAEAAEDGNFLGFVSQGIYNNEGELIGDMRSVSMAAAGRNHQPRDLGKTADFGQDKRPAQSFNTTQQHATVLQSGLEILPRSAARPTVRGMSPVTTNLIAARPLSTAARAVLTRTNYHRSRSLEYNYRNDVWAQGRRMMRRRGMQVMATVLRLALNRGDYGRAQKALAVLLRSPEIVMRNLWMPAVEILAWQHSQGQNTRTPTTFLDWIIVNFPALPVGANIWQKAPRADYFRPQAIMSRLANKDYRGAMLKAEEAILTVPTNSDPLCWALAGLAALKLQEVHFDDRGRVIQKYFSRCIELGGVLPQRYLDQLSDDATGFGFGDGLYSAEQSADDGDIENESAADSETASSDSSSESDSETVSVMGPRSDSGAHHTDSKDELDLSMDDAGSSSNVGSSSDNAPSDDGEIKPEVVNRGGADIKAENMVQSQASTMGAAWTDSESDDFP